MWYVTSQKYGANALGLQRVLDLCSYNTAWEWLHRLRRVMVRPGRELLSGTVEVDETYVGGKRPGKRGRGAANKSLVLIAVEDKSGERDKGMGRIRLECVADASANSLVGCIRRHIALDSTIRTDGWASYESLTSEGYGHKVLSSKELVITHLVASLLKRWLLGTYQGAVQPVHIDYYLDEYTFRFNRRTSASRGKLFYRLVQQAVRADPVPRQKIVGGSRTSKQTDLGDVPF